MHLFIHAAERNNAFLMLVGKSKEFYQNKEPLKSKELIEFLTFDDHIVHKKCITGRKTKTPDILIEVDALLKKFKCKPQDLKGICVLSGPGQFSFLRSGIIVANTFGLALDIPVVGITGDEFHNEKDFVLKGVRKLVRIKRFHPVEPAYGKEPNITISKKKI